MPNRREFLAAGALGLASSSPLRWLEERHPLGSRADSPVEKPPPRQPLSILILGGTSFIGPHLVADALSRGHAVSTFTRGRTEPTIHRELFDRVEELVGDRADDLRALEGRRWDAVIDNSGQEVAWTRASAELLKDSVGRYVYTSSTGVYFPYRGERIDETTEPLLEVPADADEGLAGVYGYGVMKANSERVARETFGDDRTIVVRPTYIIGPADSTDRFPYWPERLARGGDVLVPGRASDPVQWIDVRDLAAFMIRLIEEEGSGTYNVAGPASRTGMLRFVHGAHAAFSSPADFTVVDDYDFLSSHGLRFAVPWIMPVEENYGSARIDPSRAVAAGLTFRPLADSVRDIHHWWRSDAVAEERRRRLVSGEGALMAREAEILAAWRARG